MKIGLSTGSLQKLRETEESFVLLKELGAETCGVDLQTFYEYRPEFAKKYAERLAGVEVHSVGVASNNFEPQLFSSSRRIRGDGFYWLDQILRAAQIFGVKNYSFRCYTDAVENLNYDETAERMREIVDFCAHYGVKLCLENTRHGLYNKPAIFRELKYRGADILGVFNIGQARKSCYPYNMYIKDMESCISHVHISDVDENGNVCLPGRGTYDFKEVFKNLRGAGFDGAVLIETTAFDDISEIKKSIEFLKEIAYRG
ncbi:MAG: sugar phosphate isomerase/epimerase [Clostridia bacterium]|nr:sugar phosphate isomerase/epimerase [Clostridia bacterium]